jgi:hypothetical protein
MDVDRNKAGTRDTSIEKRERDSIKVQRDGGDSDSLNHGCNLHRSSRSL